MSPSFYALNINHISIRSGNQGATPALTPLVRLQLSLQVFGGHVEVLILSVSGSRFTSAAAAVTAAAQAAAEVAAGGQAADHKQSLQREDPRINAPKKTAGSADASRS